MPFPARDYYSLKLLQKRWNAPWEEITHVVETGHLRACVHLPVRWMEYGHYEESKFIVDKTAICDGMVAIQAKDTRRIFARGENTVCVFQSIKRDAYLLRLAAEPPQKPLKFALEELVVLAKDCLAFEQEHKIEVCDGHMRLLHADDAPEPPESNTAFSHDYHLVRIDGQNYHLGEKQAVVVRSLHEAMIAGRPWLFGKTLLKQAGSTSNRLRDIFRTQPAWKMLIKSDGRGYYCLNLPAEQLSDKPAHAAPQSEQNEQNIREAV